MLVVSVGKMAATGPLLTGAGPRLVREYLDEALDQVSLEARDAVRSLGMSQYQRPTGYYSSMVVARRDTAERYTVHDSMVVYGPWLEGIGSRNATSRFKGYRTWRLTTQRMRRRAPGIAIRVLKRYMPRLGG